METRGIIDIDICQSRVLRKVNSSRKARINVRSIIYGAIKDDEKQLRHDIAHKAAVRENSVDFF